MQWDNLYSSTPPYQPTVDHELDTQNFENFAEQVLISCMAQGLHQGLQAFVHGPVQGRCCTWSDTVPCWEMYIVTDS